MKKLRRKEKGNLLQHGTKFLLLIIFICTLLLLGICFWAIKELLINLFANQAAIVALIRSVFPYVGGIANICITTAVTAWTKEKLELIFNAPRILIRPKEIPNCNGFNVSGEKRERPIVYPPQIKIGGETATYRIIFAKIINVGKISVSECTINGQKISLYLDPGKDSNLYFVLYMSEDSTKRSNQIILPYMIRDIYSNKYVGSFCMVVDTSRCKAVFNVHKKIKKERN